MEDFKEVAYFTFSLFVAAFIITLVATLGMVVGQMAQTRNAELLATENLKLSRYYSAYDNQTVTGSDVIALMRENAVKNLRLDIYVDRDSGGASLTMTAANSNSDTWRLSNLTRRITSVAAYRAILVNDGENPATAVFVDGENGTVTGVKFVLE